MLKLRLIAICSAPVWAPQLRYRRRCRRCVCAQSTFLKLLYFCVAVVVSLAHTLPTPAFIFIQLPLLPSLQLPPLPQPLVAHTHTHIATKWTRTHWNRQSLSSSSTDRTAFISFLLSVCAVYQQNVSSLAPPWIFCCDPFCMYVCMLFRQ